MLNGLPETVPGFDQPIAVLKHCHDRIRKQIKTMQNLLIHLPQNEQKLDLKQAANSVLRYFSMAAPHHHADEEEDLLPMLQATAKDDDATLLMRLLPEIMDEHQKMDALWKKLEPQLQAIAAETSSHLSADDVEHFSALYASHMEKEESHIAPMAKRLFSAAQMSQLGDAMRTRRGIAE